MRAVTIRQAIFSLIVVMLFIVSTALAESLPDDFLTGMSGGDSPLLDQQVLRSGCCTLRGDVNCDGVVAMSDLNMLVRCTFWPTMPCTICCDEHKDIDGDGAYRISDLTWFINYLFKGGPAPMPCL